MALKLKWPFDSKIIPVSSGGKFGRWGYYDKIAGFPHQGSDYGIKCNTDWWWPLSGRIDLFEKRSYGYGYYSRIHAGNGWYFGIAHNNKLAGYKGKRVKAGEYGGKTGNTGLGKGCHVHIELRNPQGKVVNPETNIQWIPRKKKVADMYKGKSAEGWYKSYRHATSVATVRSNRFKVVAKKLGSILKKPIPKPDDFKTISSYLSSIGTQLKQQDAKLKTLDGHVKSLQKDLKEFTTTISTQRETITNMGVDILTLKNKLQDSQRGSERRTKQLNSIETVWLFIKDLFKGKV